MAELDSQEFGDRMIVQSQTINRFINTSNIFILED